jgi:hypothetical protein
MKESGQRQFLAATSGAGRQIDAPNKNISPCLLEEARSRPGP